MGGKTEFVRGALSSLRDLYDAIRGGYKPLSESEKIGKYIRELPTETYFKRAPTPAGDIGSARSIYDVRMEQLPSGRTLAVPQGVDSFYGHTANSFPIGDVFRGRTRQGMEPEDLDILKALSNANPKAKLYTIDASMSSAGMGGGTRTYPAIYDLLSGKEGQYNISTGLSPLNVLRKQMTTADAIKRNPELANRIIPSMQMTRNAGITPLQYAHMSPDQQTGMLMLSGARGGLENLDNFASATTKFSRDPKGDSEFLRELGGFLLDVNPRSPRDTFDWYSELFGDRLGRATGIGEGTLRKMNIMDALLQGREGELPASVIQDLSYRRGGLVGLQANV